MNPIRLLLVLIPVCLALGAAQARADDIAEPQRIIQTVSDRLQGELTSNRSTLRADLSQVYALADEVLMPHVDTDRVAQLVLGKYWRTASQEQRSTFTSEFKQLLLRTYAAAFADAGDWRIEHLPMRLPEGSDDALVRTRIQSAGAPPVSVSYRMARGEHGWQAYDVVIEGVSLITTYRNGFQREVERGGVDGLIQRMAQMNRERAVN